MEYDPTYEKICSTRTVQSEKKGFFNDFCGDVRETCGDKWLKNYFGKLKSNAARVLSIFSDREVCDPVLGVLEHVQPVYKQKDAVFSFQRRAQADKFYLLSCSTSEPDERRELLQQALLASNLAVMRAPERNVNPTIDDGLTLALAYRSRASILIGLGEGEPALSDLKLASNFGLELKSNVDYYCKMAKAYATMGEAARAEISLKIAEKLAGADTSHIAKMRTEIAGIKPVPKEPSTEEVPQLVHGENPELSGAANVVKLVETKEKGRFVVASEGLKTGDVVLCENPVAACLIPAFFGTHCHHCFKRLHTPVACLLCSGIAFCSAQCMGEACSSYHRFECEFMDLLIGSGMSILCFIALRIFTQAASVDKGLATANLLFENLCSHEDVRQAEDYLQRSLMAGFLMRILQKAQYFGQRKTEGVNPTAVELQVATALLGLLQVLQYNAHEIYQTQVTDEHRFEGSKTVHVGAGLYGTGSYFNHECWPSVASYFVGKKLVLAATKPHRPHEWVAVNYGPIFTNTNLKERQRSLRGRYSFSCSCMACQENWPLLQKLDKQVRFWCTSANCVNLLKFPKDLAKDVRCPRCRKNVSLKESVARLIKIEELYREAAQAMQAQKTGEAIELFKEGIDQFFQVAALPHKDTLLAQHSLTKCVANTGTTFKK
ncbi:SET and MYND domain-containing protein 4 [Drosophila guanche]|uniref:Blast:SET and MYND domain-containing protein 4 n=1 Tax=Drosophila guanche TaxID=7266 RepID=A0A3B0JZB2_DROGU|nr:SET and MYND domain-containing protein 4 [Drosophila guanche]SPP87417.1 blast:SET and MYND domain-containing protein 4 [Drosophila guanche]